MELRGYFQKLDQKRADRNISLICLHQRHKDIEQEVNLMIQNS